MAQHENLVAIFKGRVSNKERSSCIKRALGSCLLRITQVQLQEHGVHNLTKEHIQSSLRNSLPVTAQQWLSLILVNGKIYRILVLFLSWTPEAQLERFQQRRSLPGGRSEELSIGPIVFTR
ncbi:hypothetical protein ACJX0J_027985, partial [Zea mays]